MKDAFRLTPKPRDEVELTLDDGRVITGTRGARLEAFAEVV